MPDRAELVSYIKRDKAEQKAAGVKSIDIRVYFDFGDGYPLVDAEKMLDIMDCLPDAEVYAGTMVTPLYFHAANGEGLVCPVSSQNGMKAKAHNRRTMDADEQAVTQEAEECAKREQAYAEQEERYAREEAEREQRRKDEEERERKKYEQAVADAEQAILGRRTVENAQICIPDTGKRACVILHLMKRYGVNVPMRTQGWINSALRSLIPEQASEKTC